MTRTTAEQLQPGFKAQHDQYREHNGKPFTVLDIIVDEDETHDAEILPMYLILLETGEVIEAWPDEVERAKTHYCTYCQFYGDKFEGTYSQVFHHAEPHPIGHMSDMCGELYPED